MCVCVRVSVYLSNRCKPTANMSASIKQLLNIGWVTRSRSKEVTKQNIIVGGAIFYVIRVLSKESL